MLKKKVFIQAVAERIYYQCTCPRETVKGLVVCLEGKGSQMEAQ